MPTFTDAEKVLIRKYAGYMAFGNVPYGNVGWRYTEHYGAMEFRLNVLTQDEIDEVRNNFLPNLALLFSDIPNTRENSDTKQAAVWYRNPTELQERRDNYNDFRRQMCDFIGIPYGPALRKTQLRLVI